MEVNVKVLRATVIDGKDVFPGQKVRTSAAVARRLAAQGKVEEVRRGRPRKQEPEPVQEPEAAHDDVADEDDNPLLKEQGDE